MTNNLCLCGLRLSVANVNGICDACAGEILPVARSLVISPDGRKLCRCGQAIARWSTYECSSCAAQRVRGNRARARQAVGTST